MVVATDSNRSVESVCFGAAQTKRASDFSLEAPQFERTVCKPTSKDGLQANLYLAGDHPRCPDIDLVRSMSQ